MPRKPSLERVLDCNRHRHSPKWYVYVLQGLFFNQRSNLSKKVYQVDNQTQIWVIMSRLAGHVAGPACIGGVKCNPVAVPVQPEKTTNLINATRLVHTSGDGITPTPYYADKKLMSQYSLFVCKIFQKRPSLKWAQLIIQKRRIECSACHLCSFFFAF